MKLVVAEGREGAGARTWLRVLYEFMMTVSQDKRTSSRSHPIRATHTLPQTRLPDAFFHALSLSALALHFLSFFFSFLQICCLWNYHIFSCQLLKKKLKYLNILNLNLPSIILILSKMSKTKHHKICTCLYNNDEINYL